jgi:cytoskeletal protein RodZ
VITTVTVANDSMNFTMTNTTAAAITVSQVTFSWTGGPAQWNRMQFRIPSSAAWTSASAVAVNNGVARALTTNFTLTANGTANDTGLFRIRFTGAITVGNAVNISLNAAGAAGTFTME